MAERSLRHGVPFWLAAAWVACIVIGAVGAALLPLPAPDRMDWTHLAAAPGVAGHLLGTDGMGRDILSRLLFGARVSLSVGFFSPCIGLMLGASLGVVAGFYRRTPDRIITGMVDVFISFPRLIFLLMVLAVFGASTFNVTLALGLLCAPPFARVARANTLRLAEREFVLAAKAAGATDLAVIVREILPNVLTPMLAYLFLVMGLVIIGEGSLGFLGMSVPSPTPSWGGMIAEGRDTLDAAPHISMLPSAVMFLTILSVNLIGDRMRHYVDPRESQL